MLFGLDVRYVPTHGTHLSRVQMGQEIELITQKYNVKLVLKVSGFGERAQSIHCFLCKDENLSLDLQHHRKARHGGACWSS